MYDIPDDDEVKQSEQKFRIAESTTEQKLADVNDALDRKFAKMPLIGLQVSSSGGSLDGDDDNTN